MRTRRQQSSSYPVPLRGKHRVSHAPRVDEANSVVLREASHTPVLLEESIAALTIQPKSIVMDATLGGAGHARAICEKLGERGIFIGFDADREAVERAEKVLAGTSPKKYLYNANFRDCASHIAQSGISHLDGALFDLGWSGYQLGAGRGFSFLAKEPLFMTYGDPEKAITTASRIVNTWKEETIADILFGWGDERFAKRIARRIVEARARAPIQTAYELGEIVKSAVPGFYRRGALHPATKTFQALRIAVNDEIGALKEGISSAWKLLTPGGILAVISFHSVEDREVKRLFLEWGKEEGKRVTKSPITPSFEEIRKNPRARSAKLRVIQKV